MTQSVTTSIRLSIELRKKLDYMAKKLHRGKNWIIVHALMEYIERLNASQSVFAKEAKRQSLLATRKREANEEKWENESDQEGWV